MTKKEALQGMINFEVGDTLLEKVMVDRGITPGDTYAASEKQEIDLALADLCLVLISTPDISEGGLSIKYDRLQLLTTRRTILRKYGLEDETESTITGEARW